MNYIVLDTCSILHILRGNYLGEKIIQEIDSIKSPVLVISVVTKAELNSIKIKLGWGTSKTKVLDDFINSTTCIDINSSDSELINAYVSIDSYSQGKSFDKNGEKLNGSAKNMGKNDLWIAATSLVLDCPLITCDGDFTHLNDKLIHVINIK
ncbi:PIN domain-containing protein [Chryseobacterium sp. T1]